MRAGAHERLGKAGIVGSPIGTPCPPVNENIDGGMRSFRPIDVELLDLGWTIGDAIGRADRRTRAFAVGDPPSGDLLAIRGVDDLVIGIVERLLIHVEPNERTLRAWRLRPHGSTGRDRRAGRRERAAGDIVIALHGHAAFVIVPPVELSTTTGLSNQVMAGLAP